MARPYFRKTLLALAIVSPQPLLAEIVQLSGQQATLHLSNYSTPLILIGQAIGNDYAVDLKTNPESYFSIITNHANLSASGEDSRGLGLSGLGMWGDLTNEGQISTSGLGSNGILLNDFAHIGSNLINSAAISSNGVNSTGMRVSTGAMISGSLISSGSISAIGAGATGVELSDNATIFRSLENSGNIQAVGQLAKGIYLRYSSITGPLLNSGRIEVSGDFSSAISLENQNYVTDLVNTANGLISATGSHSRGISLDQGDFHVFSTSIANDGRIHASGPESIGIYIDHPHNIHNILNTGEITAEGDGSRAIFIGNGIPNDSIFSQNIWLENYGTIKSESIAIEVQSTVADDQGIYSSANIYLHEGLIEGRDAAIKSAGNLHISLYGGEVRGDILGANFIYASGNSLLSSELIQSSFFDIGSLELGKPHTRLVGDLLRMYDNSELTLNLHTHTDPHRAILEVSGIARIGDNVQIRLKPASEDFRGLPLREYVLISAAQIDDQGATYNAGLQVTSLSDLLQIQSYEVTDTQVTAVVKSLSTAQVGDYLSEHGAQPHLLPAFSAFYGTTLGRLGNEDPLFEATVGSNDEELVRLAEQLPPEVNGAVGQTAVSNHNLLGNVLQGRSASLRQGLSSGDGLSQTGAWVQLLDSDADQGERDGIPGYDADSQGIAIGADGKLNAQTTLGLAYSYLTSDVRSQTGNKTDIQGHALTLYGGFEQGAWFADAGLTYGRSDNESRRYIAGTRAEGDYDSELWGLSLLGGYGFDLGQGLLLEPRMAARYSNVQIDGFREQGSSAALAVGEQRYEVGEIGAGVRLAGNFAAGQGRLEPEARLMAYHDLIADQVSSTSAFLVGGTPFVTSGAKPARDSYEASLGLTYRLGAVSLGASYDYLSKADYSADTVQARVRYDF